MIGHLRRRAPSSDNPLPFDGLYPCIPAFSVEVIFGQASADFGLHHPLARGLILWGIMPT
jgi:hypothetical protein